MEYQNKDKDDIINKWIDLILEHYNYDITYEKVVKEFNKYIIKIKNIKK